LTSIDKKAMLTNRSIVCCWCW